MTRMAYNPPSFFLTAKGGQPELAPPLPTILGIVKDAGYDGIQAEVPQGSTVSAYAALLADNGLAPAPGYFQASFADTETLPQTLESARRVAHEHAALGLDRIFIAEQFGANPQRTAMPAVGIGSNPETLERISDGLGKVARAMAEEGVVPCLHAHVGTQIETVAKTEFVLDSIDLDGALAALKGFDGWFIVEVDIADQPTIAESARLAAQWLVPRLQARRVVA